MKNIIKNKFILLIPILSSISFYNLAARDFSKTEISVTPVNSNVYMLKGAGGNIGLLATDDGLVLVDDQFAPLAEKIEAAMRSIKDVPIKYVVNTHYHGDHTGSNAHFAQHAPIFAHANVRKRVEQNNGKSGKALPVVTYEQGVNIHIGNEEVQLIHYPHGHTDGDSVVYFKDSNVIHMGDLFFNGRFPYIDLKAGGTVLGYLADNQKIFKNLPANVKIIPGHGELAQAKDLASFISMLEYSINRVKTAIAAGKTEQQILAAGIGEKYESWGWNFISEERWLKTLIKDLS